MSDVWVAQLGVLDAEFLRGGTEYTATVWTTMEGAITHVRAVFHTNALTPVVDGQHLEGQHLEYDTDNGEQGALDEEDWRFKWSWLITKSLVQD